MKTTVRPEHADAQSPQFQRNAKESLKTLISHGTTVAFVAAFLQQILHEATHGLAALFVGKDWVFLNLFATGSVWPGTANDAGDALVAGSAAIVNVICGGICVLMFKHRFAMRYPMWRLFLLYFGAFSLFAGFGYLMFDALLYSPRADIAGDWQKVVHYFGGGREMRIYIFLVGAAGSLFGFFWLPYSVVCLGNGKLDKQSRVRLAFALLMFPYLFVSTVFCLLALKHPLGPDGTFLVFLKYWFGYIGFFWGFFIAAFWANLRDPIPSLSPLPSRFSRPWLIASLIAFSSALILIQPTVSI